MQTIILAIEGNLVTLKESPFRMAGGGQPCDYGILKGEGFLAKVIAVPKQFQVQVKVQEGTLVTGKAEALIDLKRRTLLTRMHTAEHLFFKALEYEIPTLKLDKISLGEKESLLIVHSETLTWEFLFKAETTVNQLIEEGRVLKEHIVSKTKVKETFPTLRIKLERIKEDTVRVIEVEGFDLSACSGTHTNTTKEVGNFLVTKFNAAGQNIFEIRFTVDVLDVLYNFSKVAREVSTQLGTALPKIIPTLTNMQTNLEKYKKMARDVKVDPKKEQVGDILFLYNQVAIESKQLMQQIGEMLKEKTVVCFLNETGKSLQIMIGVSEDLDLDAGILLKQVNQKFNGKGGGKKEFAMGAIETDKCDEVFRYLKELLQ